MFACRKLPWAAVPSRRTALRAPRRLFLSLAAVLAAGVAGRWYRPTIVVGGSMLPTLRPGQLVWVDTTAYAARPPRRGEVVVLQRGPASYVKRIYRGPGETVYFTNYSGPQDPFVLVSEHSASAFQARYGRYGKHMRVLSLRVPRGCVFVVGDNTEMSMDSRAWGAIPIHTLVGRVRTPATMAPFRPAEYVVDRALSLRAGPHRSAAAAAAERWGSVY